MPSKYRNVVRAFYANQWAILPEKMDEIREFLAARAAGVVWTPDEIQARIGDRPQAYQPPMGSKVAVLSLFGVMAQRMNALEQTSGGTSTEVFGQAFDDAIANEDVKAVVLNIDSPGGAVMGTLELAAKIFAARGTKPIIASVNSLAASAAFWVASQADEIVITPSGQIGSLGVLAIHRDESKAMENEGITETIVSAGPFKAEQAGPLGKEAKEYIQGMVDAQYTEFVATVAKGRGVSPGTAASKFGQGRMVNAQQAVAAGMADRIGTLQQVLSEFGVTSSPSGDATSAPAFQMKGFSNMNKNIFGALVRIGMCQINATEADAEKALGRFFAVRSTEQPDTDEATLAALQAYIVERDAVGTTPTVPAAVAAPAPAAVMTGMSTADIIAAVNISSLSDADKLALQSTLLSKPMQTADVMKAIQDKAAATAPAQGADRMEFGEAQIDKFAAEARDALICRQHVGRIPETIETRGGDVIDFAPSTSARRNQGIASLPKLATMCFIESGYDARAIHGMSNVQLSRAILSRDPGSVLGLRAASDGPAYNVTGLFNNILLDAANVTLRRSYSEVPTTFDKWMRQGPSVPDFKVVNKVIAGELSDPRAIPEDGEFEETTISDAKETYKLVTWGEVWSITWQAIVNDQLSAFTEIPGKQGTAMRRKQNKLAYAVLKDNAAMADTGTLFNATAVTTPGGHANMGTGAAIPAVATLSAAAVRMVIQPGITTGTTLGIEPRYIVAPYILRSVILQVLGSQADPVLTGNSAMYNVWYNGLTPVFDAQLDAAHGGVATTWYLAADSSQVDTIEYAYLQGLETPAFDQEVAFDRLAIRQRIYQAFAVKAIDWRGLVKEVGA